MVELQKLKRKYAKHKMLSVCVCDRDGCSIPYGISLQEVFSAGKKYSSL